MALTCTVPELRVNCVQDIVEIARAVRGITWIEAAQLQCWLAGRGSMAVPAHCPGVAVSSSTTTTLRYWHKPRYQTCRYAYSVVLRAAYPTTAAVRVPSGGTPVVVPVGTRDAPRPYTIYSDPASQGTTEEELSLDIFAPAGTDITVESVSIEALPRTLLDPATSDLGAQRLNHFPRRVIAEPYLVNEILDRLNDLRDACRRNGFMFSRGTASPWTFTGGTTALFDDTISITGRYLFNGDKTRTMRCRILAQCSDDETAGEFKLSNATDSLSIEIPAGTTSWTWLPTNPASSTFLVKAEDNTMWNGFRDESADEHSFTGERKAGTGTVRIASICIYDAAD